MISHAVVLPDQDFHQWLDAVRPYMEAFERVVVVRSPGGNDLNRFRNVTAIQVPRVWQGDDALGHIRRIYPSVVRVDVIAPSSPAELRSILQARIDRDDRYGETLNTPRHIFDRFILNWPTAARPSRIEKPFVAPHEGEPHEGVEITAPAGSPVLAAAPGTVTRVVAAEDGLGYGAYVRVTFIDHDTRYIVTYGHLSDIKVAVNDNVNPGDEIARSAGSTVKLVLQNPDIASNGFRVPNVVDPTLYIYYQGLRLRPTVNALRVRSAAGTHGDIVGLVTPADWLETNEPHGRALEKIGVEGKWIRIVRPDVRNAYAAGWYLTAFSTDDPPQAIPGVALPGVNIDLDHHLGRPDPAALKNLGWVRLLYNVSLDPRRPQHDPARHGNVDLDFTFSRYRPVLESYAAAGVKTVLVLTHQTFGEGQGYVWHDMNPDRWRDLVRRWTEVVGRIAAQFAGTGLVFAYQIWNEQDTDPKEARAAVPMPEDVYASLLTEAIKAIRARDATTQIITGGHVSGHSGYIRKVFDLMGSAPRPDGVAFHPYGKGPQDSPFAIFGRIEDIIVDFSRVLPGKPLWITEWGVLDRQHDANIAGQVTQYASTCLNIMERRFTGQIAAAIWYAWADGMDNGYGLVRADGQPKQPLYDHYLGFA